MGGGGSPLDDELCQKGAGEKMMAVFCGGVSRWLGRSRTFTLPAFLQQVGGGDAAAAVSL